MSKIVRLSVTPAQHKALRLLAAERDQSMQTLLTEAVRVSPLTKQAFQPEGSKA